MSGALAAQSAATDRWRGLCRRCRVCPVGFAQKHQAASSKRHTDNTNSREPPPAANQTRVPHEIRTTLCPPTHKLRLTPPRVGYDASHKIDIAYPLYHNRHCQDESENLHVKHVQYSRWKGRVDDRAYRGRVLEILAGSQLYYSRLVRRSFNLMAPSGDRSLRDLWKATELSAGSFADEVAAFYRLPRTSLPQLLAAKALVAKFTPRFLREAVGVSLSGRCWRLSPCDGRSGRHGLATRRRNRARRRCRSRSGVVRGYRDSSVELASRAMTLRRRAQTLPRCIPKTTSRACATSQAALQSCVRSTIFWRRRPNCARPTSTSSRSGPVSSSACGSTDCCVRFRRRRGILPQALVSRIKILSGLNIAERRLPQDGAARLRIARRRVRRARRHHADAARRGRSDPPLAARARSARHRQAWPVACRRSQAHAHDRAAPWHDRGHRPDRQRQDYDTRDGAHHSQRDDAQDPHHRGSCRIRDSGRQSDAGEAVDRADLLQCACVPSSGRIPM